MVYARNIGIQWEVHPEQYRATIHLSRTHLDSGGLGTGLEGVGQATLAAVLAVVVEGHLEIW